MQEHLGGAQATVLQLDSFPTSLLQPLVLLSQQVPEPQPHHSALKERARGGEAVPGRLSKSSGKGWVLSAGRRRIAHIPTNLRPSSPGRGTQQPAAAPRPARKT